MSPNICELRSQQAEIEKQIKAEELKQIKLTAERRQKFDEGKPDYDKLKQVKLAEIEALKITLEKETKAAEERRLRKASTLSKFEQEQQERQEKEQCRLASLTELELLEDDIITLQENIEYQRQRDNTYSSYCSKKKRPGEKDYFIYHN